MVKDMDRFFMKYMLPLLLLVAAGCERVAVETANGGTADLVLNLGLDGKPAELVLSKASDPEVLASEGLHTLRVFVTRGTPGQSGFEIIYNEKFTDAGNSASAPVLQYGEMTIPDIPVGTVSIYCIGNEESLGKTYDNETIIRELGSSPKLVMVDEGNTCFPKSEADIQTFGLPISGHRTGVNVRDGMGPISIEMKRLAVKLNLIVENATASELTLEGVSYGTFSGDKLYVFPTENLDVPYDIQYEPFAFGTAAGENSIGLLMGPLDSDNSASGNSECIYRAYIYPTYALRSETEDNPYTISLNVRNTATGTILTNLQYPRTFGIENTNFRANTQVNIRARITSETDIIINFDVMAWDDYEIDVPDFN